MRRSASLAYLLARISDTLADTANASIGLRLESLQNFQDSLYHEKPNQKWSAELLGKIHDTREKNLLENSIPILEQLRTTPLPERQLIHEVLAIIISGQQQDLTYFSNATKEQPVAFRDDAQLEDYTWRVAGCVGAFWTKLGFLTLGEKFSTHPQATLIDQAIAYGKGLQLINILRDLTEDLNAGRCYLPVSNPLDREEILSCHAKWQSAAEAWISKGRLYSQALSSRRLRTASILPALIAQETLNAMREPTWRTLEQHIKIPRSRVYSLMICALCK